MSNKHLLQNIKGQVFWLGLAAALIAVTVVGYAAHSEYDRYYYWSNWISHTQVVLDTIEEERVELFNALVELATFYQTGDSHKLNELEATIAQLQDLTIQLRALTRDNSHQQVRLNRAESILSSLTALLRSSPYSFVDPETRETIKQPTVTSMAALFDQIRDELYQISSEEDRLLKERLTRAHSTSRRSIGIMSVGGSLVFAWLLLVSAYAQVTASRLRRSAKNLAHSERELIRAAAQRRTDEQFRKIIESVQDAMIVVGKSGRIVLVNGQAEKLFGYSRTQLLNMTSDMLSPLRLRAEYSADPRLRSPGSGLEFYGLRMDGSEFPVEVSVGQTELEGSTVICMAVRDITVRKKMERELRESDEHYRMLVQNVQDYAIFMLDPEGRVVSWNEGAQRIKGYTAEEIIGRHFSCFYPPEDIATGKPTRELTEARETGRCEDEGWRIRKGGSRFWANVVITALFGLNGEIKGFSKITRDVTERQLAEERFRGLLESAPDAMLLVGNDGRIVLANARTTKLFGYRRRELLNQPIEILLPERFRRRHPEYRNGYFVSPKPRAMGVGVDLAGLRKNGTEFVAEISLSPITTPHGTSVIAAVRDITERRRLDQEHYRKITEANRLKSEFLANMSHELRTPLNAIIGFASLIESKKVGPLNDDQAEYMSDILTSSRHLLHLINDVLDLAKIEAGKMEFRSELFDLATTTGEVIDTLRALAAEKHIRITSNVAPDLVTVNIDPGKFKQVLYNYLSNAIKFTPENGTVMVRVKPEGNDCFRLEVEDTGIGIGPDDVSRLFVEFQQLDASPTKRFGGTGLGLSLTKHIVEAQGGSVSVHSELGKGSIFVAVLPRTMETSEEPTISPVPRNTTGRPILVVEDNQADRSWLIRTLSNAGYSLETAGTGAEAVRLCNAKPFAAVTLDLLLPDASGWEVLREVRSSSLNRQVPVIVVTLSRDQGLSSAFVIQDYLMKPVEEDILLESLKQAGVHTGDGLVLVVDKDIATLKLVSAKLSQLGYRTVCESTAEQALEVVRNEAPAVIVLELLLPGMNGFQFLDQLRRTAEGRYVPVIVWTAKDLSAEERLRLRDSAQAIVPRDGAGELLKQLSPYLPSLQHEPGHSLKGNT